MNTYRSKHEIEHCAACDLDLTLTREMKISHECEKSDLYMQSLAYRQALKRIFVNKDDENLRNMTICDAADEFGLR